MNWMRTMENKLKHERERDLLCSGMFRLNVLDFWFDNSTPPFVIVLTYSTHIQMFVFYQCSGILDSVWSIAAFCSQIFLYNDIQTVYLTVAPATSNSVVVSYLSYHPTDKLKPTDITN